MKALEIYAGSMAREQLAINGFDPSSVMAIPGAAGGPKGLILQGLDLFLFGELFNEAHLTQRQSPLQLIGASIGAWRMAAACSTDPLKALERLAYQYCEAQRYRKGVRSAEITEICNQMIAEILGSDSESICNPTGKQLLVWVNKGKKPLFHARNLKARKRGFASATLANSVGRERLKNYFERWVFATGDTPKWLREPFDGMDCRFEALTPNNLQPALLGSASIPFILDPVPQIPIDLNNQISGPFWDGGLTDYHLALPYHRQKGLVLYPHFGPKITPGWLDKFLKKRKANPEWMSNVLLICPSEEFINSLPAKKIPDRKDFKIYGTDHDERIRNWKVAISESHRLAEEFAKWLNNPDLNEVKPI